MRGSSRTSETLVALETCYPCRELWCLQAIVAPVSGEAFSGVRVSEFEEPLPDLAPSTNSGSLAQSEPPTVVHFSHGPQRLTFYVEVLWANEVG